MERDSLCIGLFGTCGKSTWRQQFIEKYEKRGYPYFNPQVDDWKPECAVEEAWHLAHDQVILFPVLDETYGLGSLAETGFSILGSLRLDDRRDVVILIDQKLTDGLMEDAVLAKESLKDRALVREHIRKLRLDNVYVVDSLEEMLEVSIALFEARLQLNGFRARFNPHKREL